MRKNMLFLLLWLPACAINRVPSLNMLEYRADYSGVRRVKKHLSSLRQPLISSPKNSSQSHRYMDSSP